MIQNMLDLIDLALREDIGTGDVTTNSIIPPGSTLKALILAKESGVIAGLPIAQAVFHRLNSSVWFQPLVREGEQIEPGKILARVEGDGQAILTGERTALNFLQHLSGIATRTARLLNMIKGYKAKVVDTRKTTPGLRALEKYAVRVGGGTNHRFGLYDAVLIKDNHIQVAGSITRAVQLARATAPFTMKIEVEAENLEQVKEALSAGVDIIMLDNMDPSTMRQAVEMAGGRAILEASGRISEDNILAVAQTGVDFISIGALTHSVQAVDISMEVISS